MKPERAHWYSILLPSKSTPGFDEKHYAAFPPLSKLSSIKEEIFREVLLHCGLAMYRKNSGYSPLEKEWEYFITEQEIPEAEITHFSLGSKKRFYIRLGTWNKGLNHYPKTPENIWASAQAGTLRVPRICITLVSERFAKKIGSLDMLPLKEQEQGVELKASGEDSVSSDGLDENDSIESEVEVEDTTTVIPDQENFPLLHSLFSMNEGSNNLFNRLINEILKFNGSKVVTYAKGNNTMGTLLEVPQFRSLKGYTKEFKKKDNILVTLCDHVAKCSNCDRNEAGETILSALFENYQDSFLSVALDKGVPQKTMDEVSVEAMLSEAGVNWKSARIIFRHLKQFFGRSIAVSEKKRRAYFGDNDFPPSVDQIVLADKTIVTFWWKRPDELLQHQINYMFKVQDLELLESVDIATGGDHGGGRFRMLLKLLLRFGENKATIKKLFEIANVEHSKDDINVLKNTVLDKVVEGLRAINDGSRFIVRSDDNGCMSLSFTPDDNEAAICNVPIYLYINGDMKFFAQMLGREGMSTSWCMYCQEHPNDWKGLQSVPEALLWEIEKQQQFLQEIEAGQRKEPKDKKGIVSKPIIDFIEPRDYIFPQLHFEIGAVNNVLDALRAFIEEQVEVLSNEERECRNTKIIADVALEKAKDNLSRFNSDQLKFYRLERIELNNRLKDRSLTQESRNEIMEQKEEMDYWVSTLTADLERLKKDVSTRREIFSAASKALKAIQQKKDKSDTPTVATMENIFLQYEISPAKYHGGKLNGVDCREVMTKAKVLFRDIKSLLLSISHPNRCSDDTIIQRCNIFQDILVTMDLICSKIRIKRGELKGSDVAEVKRAKESLDYLWSSAGLSFTPKIHGVLAHAVEQVERLNGIGDLLEDDLEHLHQMSKKIADRTSRIKVKDQQARSHSQMEAKLNNSNIIMQMEKSQAESKRVFKRRRVDAAERAANAKKERDESRLETITSVEEKPYSRMVSLYESEKESLLRNYNP